MLGEKQFVLSLSASCLLAVFLPCPSSCCNQFAREISPSWESSESGERSGTASCPNPPCSSRPTLLLTRPTSPVRAPAENIPSTLGRPRTTGWPRGILPALRASSVQRDAGEGTAAAPRRSSSRGTQREARDWFLLYVIEEKRQH